MKVGDKFPISLAGHEVGVATVRAVENGQVELQFEGKRVVMATRTEIETVAPRSTGNEHALLGIEQTPTESVVGEGLVAETLEGSSTSVEGSAAPVEDAQEAQNGPVAAAEKAPEPVVDNQKESSE